MSETLQPQMPEHRNLKAEAKAATAYAKASRPWFKKKRWWAVIAVFVVAAASAAGGGTSEADDPSSGTANSNPVKTQGGSASNGSEKAQKTESEPELTAGQENALRAGQNYVDMMPFSRTGLIRQLSSPAGDSYSKADATFAANNIKVDWNAEAAEAAQNYLDTMPFSRDQLIQQLSSSAGDAFTQQQAVYGVNKTGL